MAGISTNGNLKSDVTYEDLSALEWEFHRADTEILQKQWSLFQPLYTKRNNIAARIPHFWALVFEEAPPEIDHHIQPSDSEVFADCLENVEVERFDIKKEPRNFLLRFYFGPNKWFEDKVLEKKFWYRRSHGNWQGLVSEPVKINWKKGADLSNGITDSTFALWNTFKTRGDLSSKGFAKLKGNVEYKTLSKKLETIDLSANSFFTLFAFISAFRYVDESESQEANVADAGRRERRAKGERVDEPEDENDLQEDEDIMVCPHGEDLALAIADDVYPNAIKYFTTAQDRENETDEDLDDEDEDDEESADEMEVDIRSLVSGKVKNKRQKEASTSASPPPAATGI